ncbi:MAG: hypothetical protein WC299_05675 [Kiritimatiellia bacterium]
MKKIINMLLYVSMAVSLQANAAADEHYAARNGQVPSSPYSTWATAASNIQDAVNAANTNDTVWVGAGRYTAPANAVFLLGTNIVFIDKPMMLRSSNGVPADTVLDGEGLNRAAVFWITNNMTSSPSGLNGFTVRNCYATNMGGGILFYQRYGVWTAEVRNCIVADNLVEYGTNALTGGGNLGRGIYGGGICCYCYDRKSGLLVTNSVLRNNRALSGGTDDWQIAYGGAIWARTDGLKQIVFSRVESNTAPSAGGVYFTRGEGLVANSGFLGNRAITNRTYWNILNVIIGGGLYMGSSVGTVRNSLFYENYSQGYGGAIVAFGSTWLDVQNCTIVSNRGDLNYGGSGTAISRRSGGVTVCNTIIYSNQFKEVHIASAANVFFTNCCLTTTNIWLSSTVTNPAGSGNITNAPLFVNPGLYDYRLQVNSPCINTGLNQPWMEGALDLDLHSRKDRYSGRVDMGCYEKIFNGMIYKIH